MILTLVIHEHTATAAPVGSNNLVNRYNLDFSSATVRNELSALTDLGLLRQPHTSAGREPTEEGYRYFVSNLLNKSDLPANTRRMIRHQFYQKREDMDEWMRLAASILASHAKVASLVTAPHPEKALFKHLELINTHGRQVLFILVMLGGEIHQRIFKLDHPIPQEDLSMVANRITHLFQGKSIRQIENAQVDLDEFEEQVVAWVINEMIQADSLISGEIYLDGMTNVLAEPEFASSDNARQALRLLEERSLLQELLASTVSTSNVGVVQVLIGGEGTWDELRQCSIVLSRYGSPGLATGMLGVLGPMRMPYGRTISTVSFISNLLSDMVIENLGE
jgi:heat-inducible transcriptional repressor